MRCVRVAVLALAVGCSARHQKKEHANVTVEAVSLLAPGEAVTLVDVPFTACTDVDTSGPTRRSSLGGFCCKYCPASRKGFSGASKAICCPSHEYISDGGAEVSTKPPTQAHPPPPPPPPAPRPSSSGATSLLRQITLQLEDNEYNRANLCCGEAHGDTCGDTPGGAIVIENVGQSADNMVNMVITNVTGYSPVMPRIISGLVLDADKEGWMGNGKKIHNRLSADLININQCNDKVFTARTCFVDGDQKPVLMKAARIRVFDIDMGDNPTREGPETIQFSCPGGTFEVYGETPPYVSWTAGKPFSVKHKATYNGLTKYKYNCPKAGPNELVTIWASLELGEPEVEHPTSAAPADLTVKQQVDHWQR
eukprot:scaffold60245_cov49-Phaeocystis_antarctica.AAC.3